MIRIDKRRRRQNKTDYFKRIKLLKGGKPRLVFRKTNKYIIAQYIISKEAQDSVIITVNSKRLLNYGWPESFKGSLKSIPAAYLTGYLIAKEIKKRRLEEPIIDLGMLKAIHKSKIFAFILGLIDSGVKIECKKENFPEKERISGKNLKKDFSKIFSEIKLKLDKD